MHRQHLRLRVKRSRKPWHGEGGYTLAELLVATFLGVAALAAVFSFSRFQVFALQTQTRQQELQTVGRSIIELFTREVRRAGMDPTCAKNFDALDAARFDHLRVKSDLDGDGFTSGVGEDVTYYYNQSADAIERKAGSVVERLTDSSIAVTDSMLEFFDGAGNELKPEESQGWLGSGQRREVRRIRISLDLSTTPSDAHNSTPLRARFASNVELRNRFFTMDTRCP
jgi:type II secretory pathway pseudopilin PulG